MNQKKGATPSAADANSQSADTVTDYKKNNRQSSASRGASYGGGQTPFGSGKSLCRR